MNIRQLPSAFLFFILLLTACTPQDSTLPTPLATATSVPPSSTPFHVATVTPMPSTSTPSQVPTPTTKPTRTLTPVVNRWPIEPCQLPPVYTSDVALGIPRSDDYLPSIGTVNAAVLFVDFPDVPAQQSPEEVFALINPCAVEYFEQVSYGRMHLKLTPYLKWLRLGKPSAHYADLITTSEGHTAFMQEAVDLADAEVDFGGVDLVIVLANPEASALNMGPAAPRTTIETDEGPITSGVTSGSDLPYWGFLWLNHEMGHTLSLVDLYAFDATWENEGDSPYAASRFTGIWSLMNDIAGLGLEYFAFERWQLGWLDDDQIVCQTSGEHVTLISAIEQEGGTKAVMVPLSKTTVLVVESRRAVGYDAKIPREGVLVYRVDTAIPTGRGPIQVLTEAQNDPLFKKAPLAEGQSLTYCGITITNDKSYPDADEVRVSIPAESLQCDATTGSTPTTCTEIPLPSGSDAVMVQFVNTTSKPLIGYWVDFNGNLQEYFQITPGERINMETYASHRWMLKDALSGETVLEYTATTEKQQCALQPTP